MPMLNPVDLDSLEIRLIAVAPSTDDEAKQSSPTAKAVSPFGPAAPSDPAVKTHLGPACAFAQKVTVLRFRTRYLSIPQYFL